MLIRFTIATRLLSWWDESKPVLNLFDLGRPCLLIIGGSPTTTGAPPEAVASFGSQKMKLHTTLLAEFDAI
jgi:hypothetical protein